MSGRTILKIESPTTQTVEAVKALLSWKHHPVTPLPCDVSLEDGRLVLVLSNKKDCFYVVTARDCSCPARGWHPGQPCKHQRKYFPQIAKPAAMESESIRPAAGWIGPDGRRANGPVEA